jgi:predicted metal-binding membrane protein
VTMLTATGADARAGRRPVGLTASSLVFGAGLVASWAVVVAMVTGGSSSARTHAGSTGGLAAICQLHLHQARGPVGPGLEVVRWVGPPAMVLAMMLPAIRPALDHVRHQCLRSRRTRAVAEFLVVYTAVWVAAMAGSAIALGAIRDRLSADLVGDPALALGFALAAVWQLSGRRRRLLRRCRRGDPLAVRGWGADRDACAFGGRYGLRCVATCWGLMLVAFVAGPLALVTMAVAASYIAFERTQGAGRWLTIGSAAILGVGAVASLVV